MGIRIYQHGILVFSQPNVLQLPEGGDFEALHCQPSTSFDRCTKLHLTTEPPLLGRCCYKPFLFVELWVEIVIKMRANARFVYDFKNFHHSNMMVMVVVMLSKSHFFFCVNRQN